jgi:hypothetical protein
MKLCRGILLASLVFASAACQKGPKPWEPDAAARTLFLPSVRPVGPAPVYSRTRWTQPPEVLPNRERPGSRDSDMASSAPPLRPVFQLSLKATPLAEAARVLAATSRYTSYTDPSIASQKLTIESLGTIDELGQTIEQKAQVQVVIDHRNREVRFLPPTGEQPRLFSE